MAEQTDLLDTNDPQDPAKFQPLAARMRPKSLQQYIGQEHILGKQKPLYQAIENDRLHSMIFWGPPGTGKTSLAKTIAEQTDSNFISISAVMSGVKDIRRVIDIAKIEQKTGKRTVLFVDEVHRFNKSQQDAFLPYVEDGTIILIGATTENPAFELNNALLSRARVYVIKSLTNNQLEVLLKNAIEVDVNLSQLDIVINNEVIEAIADVADGDARRALNLLEIAVDLAEVVEGKHQISVETLDYLLQQDFRSFDKGGDLFYDQISALHKAVRGSSPDGALYWMARMLDGGCDPLYLCRRVLRMASEDIGNADPRALQISLDAWHSVERLGSPEGELALAQAVVYLACAPKSNAVYKAFAAVMKDVKSEGNYAVPEHLRNAPTKLAKQQGHGENYRYAHNEPNAYAAGEAYFPNEKTEAKYYHPVNRGLEIKILEKLEKLSALDKAYRKKS
jgi:putative ATPase